MRVQAFLSDHKRRRKLLAATGIVSVLVIVGVFGSLMMPAISMEKSNPLLEADPATVAMGEKIPVKVTATSESGDGDLVFLISELDRGGGAL